MDTTVECQHCGHKHQMRPDQKCPECGKPVAAEAPPEDTANSKPASVNPPLSASSDLERGPRIAGVLLIVNALLVIVEGIAVGFESAIPSGSYVAIVIDVVVGVALLRGQSKFLVWAKIRVVAGAVLYSIIHIVSGDIFLLILQLVVSASLAGLLFGTPGKVLRGICVGAFTLYAALIVVGLVSIGTGWAPFSRITYGELDSFEEGATLDGDKYGYKITIPGDHWTLRETSAARQDNPLADRWLVWPEYDAHVVLIGESLGPDISGVAVEEFAAFVKGNVEAAGDEFEILRDEKMSHDTEAWLLHIRSATSGMSLKYLIGVFKGDVTLVQVFTFAESDAFDAVSADLEAIIASFEFY